MAAFTRRQTENKTGLLNKRFKLGAITRDVLTAIGIQEQCDYGQASQEQVEQAFSEGEQLLTCLSQICALEKGLDVPGMTLDQAVETVSGIFATCFDRFHRALETARADLKTAFTPEGRLLQVQQIMAGGRR